MKSLKYLAVIFLVCFTSTNLLALKKIEQSEIRNVKNFHAIKVSTGIDLYITMGDEESVRLEADDDIIDNIKTEVKDGTLHIYMKQKNSWFNWGFSKPRKVYVKVKELDRIDASSGSDVKSENTLKGERMEIEASSGSDVDLDLYYKTVSLSSSSGSDARLTGKAKTLIAEASSGSDINTRELKAAICKLKASSGSDISASVSDELYAKASSGADIRYFGNPSIKDTNESSGGDVSNR